MTRKVHLKDCDPNFVSHDGGVTRSGLRFACPEADGGCDGYHVIPGDHRGQVPGESARWKITGNLPNVTVAPSLRCAGACRMHIVITDGNITFCHDSKSGPDWSDK